jgi:hypothetical protein
MEQSGMTPYDLLNAAGDGFGMKDGQKPVYGTRCYILILKP